MHIPARIALFLAIVMVFLGPPAIAQANSEQGPLEVQDMRLAGISERLMVANANLCPDLMPITGIILHSIDQYPAETVPDRFGEGEIAVAALRPGSPADQAGLRRDDAVLAINGIQTADLQATAEGHLREAAFDLLANQPASDPIEVTIGRAGERLDVIISPVAGCRSLVEIMVGDGPRARSDGRVIQIRYDFANQLEDTQLATVFAHELAHTILQHRRRKEEAGIDIGILGEFGRNQQANRQAEVEADRLSVHLLANAGFNPAVAPQFWRSAIGRETSGGMFSSGIYPSAENRAALIEREIEMYLPNGAGPSWPGHLLALRERPFH